MTQDWSEKTEAPTPHRRAEARRRGNVARSAELSAALLCLAAVLLLRQSGTKLAAALRLLLADSLSSASSPITLPLGRVLLIAETLIPLAVGLLLIGLAANLVQTGFLLGLRRDARPLDPFAG